jgi:hypothetical protein
VQLTVVASLLALATYLDPLGAASTTAPLTRSATAHEAVPTKKGAAGAAAGARLFGAESGEAVIARFANYACCGLALTVVVPAAFEWLGLR